MPQVKKPCLFTAALRHTPASRAHPPNPVSPDRLPVALRALARCFAHFVQHPHPTLARHNMVTPFAPKAEDRPEYARVNDKPLDRRLALR